MSGFPLTTVLCERLPYIVIFSRMIHPIERHMEEAIENSKCGGSEDKYESCKTRKSYFKQKYIGHRNARWVSLNMYLSNEVKHGVCELQFLNVIVL